MTAVNVFPDQAVSIGAPELHDLIAGGANLNDRDRKDLAGLYWIPRCEVSVQVKLTRPKVGCWGTTSHRMDRRAPPMDVKQRERICALLEDWSRQSMEK